MHSSISRETQPLNLRAQVWLDSLNAHQEWTSLKEGENHQQAWQQGGRRQSNSNVTEILVLTRYGYDLGREDVSGG